MPGIVLLRKQIVKRFRRMFHGRVGSKPRTPLGFQPFLHRKQASNVNILSSHTPANQQRFLPPPAGRYFLPLTDGPFGLYSGVYLGCRILARGGPGFGGGGMAVAAEIAPSPPWSSWFPPARNFFPRPVC